jgi:hypothetical protein
LIAVANPFSAVASEIADAVRGCAADIDERRANGAKEVGARTAHKSSEGGIACHPHTFLTTTHVSTNFEPMTSAFQFRGALKSLR